LTIEELEVRVVPATHYWVGGAGNNNWSTAADWSDKVRPGPGDSLVFDGNAKTDSIMDAGFGNQIANVSIYPGFDRHSLSINAPLTVTNNLILNDDLGKLVTNVGGLVINPATGALNYETFQVNGWSFLDGRTEGKGYIEVKKRYCQMLLTPS